MFSEAKIRPQASLSTLLFFAVLAFTTTGALAQRPPPPPPPPPLLPLTAPPAPAGNPVTAAKADLGKVLFWDEQLSSSRTASCGSCHQPAKGGADPRAAFGLASATNPGPDGVFGTADDVTGSPGLPLSHEDGTYEWSPIFGYMNQVTGRYPGVSINAGYPNSLFWDGRATSQFVDPVTGAVVLPNGAALESQAAGPPTGDAEMAHQGRDWSQVAEQISTATPLGLAPSAPTALTNYINGRSYAELFVEAFNLAEAPTPAVVTPSRIIMAIATYERTQFSDETPLDLGQPLTAAELRGRDIFNGPGRCVTCHSGNRFTDDQAHYIGVRPTTDGEDLGRFHVTGRNQDRGRFKTPGLRNVSLRGPFMHDGSLETLADVVDFYNRGGDFNAPNKDPNVRPLGLSGAQQADLIAFLSRPLTDVRVANEQAPFDRPQLYAESARVPAISGAGVAGLGGETPQIMAIEPPFPGNPSFTVAVSNALGGAQSTLVIDSTEPPANAIPNLGGVTFSQTASLEGSGAGDGRISASIPIADLDALVGTQLSGRWYVDDPAAAGGVSATPAFSFTLFGPRGGNNVKVNGVAASDDASVSGVDVVWNPVLGAANYRLFRHTTDDFAGSTQIATGAQTSFEDTTAVAGTGYFYWVTVDGDGGQTVPSASDAGSRMEVGVVGALSATDGLHFDKVALSWGAVAGADSYQVFRHTADDFAGASQIGTPVANSFDDTTATVGTGYFYWVKSVTGGIAGDASASDAGHRGVTPPGSVAATDGTEDGKVVVSWAAVAGATSYTVFRAETDDSGSATQLGTSSTNTRDDASANPAEAYFYWVKATVNGTSSDFGLSDTGYVGLSAPGGFSASTTNSSKVALNWTASAGATSYEVFRGDADDFGLASSLGSTAGTSLADFAALGGETYFYWVQATAPLTGPSAPTGSQQGGRPLSDTVVVQPGSGATPPVETEAVYEDVVTGRWSGLITNANAGSGEVDVFGYAKASVRPNRRSGEGAATLGFYYEGQRYAARAAIAADGSLAATVPKRDGSGDVVIALQLQDTPGGRKLTGTLTDGANSGDVDLYQHLFDRRANPAPQASKYTFILPSDPNADHAMQPGGDGAGYGAVTTSGLLKARVTLGDGARATLTSFLGGDGEAAIYCPVYARGARGWVAGLLTFRDVPEMSDADGSLQWKKGASARENLYPDGFDLQQGLVASVYVVPDSRAGERALSELEDGPDNAELSFFGGNLDPVIDPKTLTWAANNLITSAAPSRAERLLTRLSTGSGAVRGSYQNATTGQRVRWNGVVFQKQGVVTGNFVGDGQSGFVQLTPVAGL